MMQGKMKNLILKRNLIHPILIFLKQKFGKQNPEHFYGAPRKQP